MEGRGGAALIQSLIKGASPGLVAAMTGFIASLLATIGATATTLIAILGIFHYEISNIITYLYEFSDGSGVPLATDEYSRGLYIASRATGNGIYYQPGVIMWPIFADLPSSLRMGAKPVVLDRSNPNWQEGWHWKLDEVWAK